MHVEKTNTAVYIILIDSNIVLEEVSSYREPCMHVVSVLSSQGAFGAIINAHELFIQVNAITITRKYIFR